MTENRAGRARRGGEMLELAARAAARSEGRPLIAPVVRPIYGMDGRALAMAVSFAGVPGPQ